MRELRQRKPNRLFAYDYSQNGAYFITICIKDRHEILWDPVVGATCGRPYLSDIGQAVENEIDRLNAAYDNIAVDCFVVMPNHVHMVLIIASCGRPQVAPTTISRVIQQWKGVITKQIGFSPWQKSFHDHIIRNEKEYCRIVEYIQNNPLNWEQDCFYTPK